MVFIHIFFRFFYIFTGKSIKLSFFPYTKINFIYLFLCFIPFVWNMMLCICFHVLYFMFISFYSIPFDSTPTSVCSRCYGNCGFWCNSKGRMRTNTGTHTFCHSTEVCTQLISAAYRLAIPLVSLVQTDTASELINL